MQKIVTLYMVFIAAIFLLRFLYTKNMQNRFLSLLFDATGPKDDVRSMTKKELYKSALQFGIIGACLLLVFLSLSYKTLFDSNIPLGIIWFASLILSIGFFIKGLTLLIVGLLRRKNYIPLQTMSKGQIINLYTNQKELGWTKENREQFIKLLNTFKWTKYNRRFFLREYETHVYRILDAPEGIGQEDLLNDITVELEMFIENKGEDSGLYYLKALAYYFTEYWEKAAECYQKALEIDYKNLKSWAGVIACFFNLEKYNEATQKISEALKKGIIKPRLRKAILILLDAEDIDKIWPKAEIEIPWKQVIKVELWRILVILFSIIIVCFIGITTVRHKRASEWYDKGWTLGNLGKYEEALEAYDKATILNPNSAVAWCNKAWVLGNLGGYREALECCNKAIRIDSSNEYVWGIKGWVLGNLNRHKDAIKACNKALSINSDDADALCTKGWALYNIGQYEEALKISDKAIDIKPNFVDAWNNKGWILYTVGQYKEAIEAYEKTISINPNFVKAWHNKGLALDKIGKHKEALEAYKRAEELGYKIAPQK
ncbi:MAG: tetratricopeptide repeat protein [bacterium]